MQKLQAQSKDGFEFTFFIEKAEAVDVGDEMILRGIASTTNVDHDRERMASHALKTMVNIVNDKTVPLRLEHQKDDNAVIGEVYKAWIDERNQMWIEARLNKDHPVAPILYNSLKKGVKLGLSVGGRVKRAVRELSEGMGKYVKTFYDVALDEVSVTQRPANYDAWLFAKSYAQKGDNTDKFYELPIYNNFLFENPHLDYMQVFAKSVPDGAWEKVEESNSNINSNKSSHMKKNKIKKQDEEMVTEDEKETEAEKGAEVTPMEDETTPEEETEKGFASIGMVSALAKQMTKGYSEITRVLKQLAGDEAKDQVNPDYVKPETEETAAKQREGQEDQGPDSTGEEGVEDRYEGAAEGDEHTAAPAGIDTEPKDQVNPEMTMPAEEGLETAKRLIRKQMEGEELEEEELEELKSLPTATKKRLLKDISVNLFDSPPPAEQMPAPKEEEEVEMNEDMEPTYGAEYQMPELQRAIKGMEKIGRKMAPTKKGFRKSKASTLDQFVSAISMALGTVQKRMEGDGKRILGLEQALADVIRNDSEIQKSIKEWMAEPGVKKSVSLNVPYMITRDGRKFRLTPEGESVQKSEKTDGKSFKEVYKSEYSSQAPGNSA